VRGACGVTSRNHFDAGRVSEVGKVLAWIRQYQGSRRGLFAAKFVDTCWITRAASTDARHQLDHSRSMLSDSHLGAGRQAGRVDWLSRATATDPHRTLLDFGNFVF